MRFTIKRGLDIPTAGQSRQHKHDGLRVTGVALVDADYHGKTSSTMESPIAATAT